MPIKSITFGRFSFDSVASAIAHISRILNSYDLLSRVSGSEDEEVLHEVLKKHPETQSKMKGLAIVGFEVHPFKGGERCFYLCREDGTKGHFGFQRCVRNAAHG